VTADLRRFLADAGGAVWRIAEPTSIVHAVTALQHQLDSEGRFPILVIEKPVLADGTIAAMPVVTNLTASRAVTAQALGIDDHTDAGRIFAGRQSSPLPPVVMAAGSAPVQAVVREGAMIDLTRLPAVKQHLLDPGPYLTAAHATTYDPDTGIDNTAIQRGWVKAKAETTYLPYPASHNALNIRKFWARGEAAPMVFWLGHHPGVLLGTQAKLKYPESHWAACGGVTGEPLRLAPSLTHGDKIMVPADAEIVIEGYVPPDERVADGPFGEYTGYLGPQTLGMRFIATRLTMRADPLYHDYGSGLTDMLVPDNMAMEGKLWSMIKPVAPSLARIHVPANGRRFHVYIALKDPEPGEARDALAAALSYRRIKTAIAVDDDIDIFDDQQILWSLATRTQWNRDHFTIDGLSTSTFDPSLAGESRVAAKMAIDATFPARPGPGRPRPVPPVARVPDEELAKAKALIAARKDLEWPRL